MSNVPYYEPILYVHYIKNASMQEGGLGAYRAAALASLSGTSRLERKMRRNLYRSR
jgi:hypothetical protein